MNASGYDETSHDAANSGPNEHRHENGFDDSAKEFVVVFEKQSVEFFARQWCALCRWLRLRGSAAIVWRVFCVLCFVVTGGGCRGVFISQQFVLIARSLDSPKNDARKNESQHNKNTYHNRKDLESERKGIKGMCHACGLCLLGFD